ncbi:hypothetical protein Tco_0031778 [Tanacetum coccineum]
MSKRTRTGKSARGQSSSSQEMTIEERVCNLGVFGNETHQMNYEALVHHPIHSETVIEWSLFADNDLERCIEPLREGVRKKVNSECVVENVLMGCEGVYVGNEENKMYNKYKESTLCKRMSSEVYKLKPQLCDYNENQGEVRKN